MIITKNLSLHGIFEFAGHHFYWLTGWMLLVTTLYHYSEWTMLTIPWLPLSLIDTTIALFIGFKNNQSYNRI